MGFLGKLFLPKDCSLNELKKWLLSFADYLSKY